MDNTCSVAWVRFCSRGDDQNEARRQLSFQVGMKGLRGRISKAQREVRCPALIENQIPLCVILKSPHKIKSTPGFNTLNRLQYSSWLFDSLPPSVPHFIPSLAPSCSSCPDRTARAWLVHCSLESKRSWQCVCFFVGFTHSPHCKARTAMLTALRSVPPKPR